MEASVLLGVLGFAGVLLTVITGLWIAERRRAHPLDNPGHGERDEYEQHPIGVLSAGLWYREFDRLHGEMRGLRSDVQKLTQTLNKRG